MNAKNKHGNTGNAHAAKEITRSIPLNIRLNRYEKRKLTRIQMRTGENITELIVRLINSEK
tara:strand:+ start:270 stop:452 length:183 start_codon:yes stop_codon:yes gene_type:complete